MDERYALPIFRVMGLVGRVVVFGMVLEFAARADDALRWNAPLLGEYSHDSLLTTDALGTHCKPGGQFEKWQLNSFGFRGPEVDKRNSDGRVRVLQLGASETFGLYERTGMEYPAQVQHMLDRDHPGKYEVINAACAGMSPPRVTHLLKVWLHEFRPQVVAFYPSPQFYLDEDAPEGGAQTRPRRVPLFTSRVAAKAKVVVKQILPTWVQTKLRNHVIEKAVRSHGSGWVWDTAPQERLLLMETHITELVKQIRAMGAIPMLMTHASRFGSSLDASDREQLVALRVFYPRASVEAILGFEHAANELIRKLGREQSIAVLDVDRGVPKDPRMFADFSHFTDLGATEVARLLATALPQHVSVPRQSEEGSNR